MSKLTVIIDGDMKKDLKDFFKNPNTSNRDCVYFTRKQFYSLLSNDGKKTFELLCGDKK